MAGGASSADRLTESRNFGHSGNDVSSIDGTIEGPWSSNWASSSSRISRRGGISDASRRRTSRSRSPISSQIARQWMWSSIIAVQLPFGLAPLVSSSLILIWLKSGKSKFVSGNARSGEKSVKPRLSINLAPELGHCSTQSALHTKKKGRLRCHKRPKSREETPKEGSDSGMGLGVATA